MLGRVFPWITRPKSLFFGRASSVAAFDVAEAARQLFAAHGLAARLENGVIRFAGSRCWVLPALVSESQIKPGTSVVQMDVRLCLESGEHVVESFAGWGATRDDAARDAVANFTANSLHVFLVAFFGRLPDDHVDTDTWTVGGHQFDAVIGPMGIRGTYPLTGEPAVHWFEHVRAEVRRLPLERRLHWIRFFYSQRPGDTPTVEALLNNETWEVLEGSLARFDWPESTAYYSVRVFLVLKPVPISTKGKG